MKLDDSLHDRAHRLETQRCDGDDFNPPADYPFTASIADCAIARSRCTWRSGPMRASPASVSDASAHSVQHGTIGVPKAITGQVTTRTI